MEDEGRDAQRTQLNNLTTNTFWTKVGKCPAGLIRGMKRTQLIEGIFAVLFGCFIVYPSAAQGQDASSIVATRVCARFLAQRAGSIQSR